MNVLLIILIILVVLAAAAGLVILFYRPLGGVPNKKDLEDYAKRSSNFKDGKFYNENFFLMSHWTDPYAERGNREGTEPREALKAKKYIYTEPGSVENVLITWFGHSTVLIQMHGMNILVDPVFAERTSPVSFAGPKRFSKFPCGIVGLPHIDMVLLTHDHYDHVDYESLRQLEDKTDRFIVPLGIDKDLEKFGIRQDKITNMAWWEELNINGLTVACTPSRHFAGRFLIDAGKALWCSWTLKDEYHTIFDSGDGGYGEHFTDIQAKYGPVDLALLDSAQYSTRWHDVHMFPEEAVQAAQDVDARIAMAVHWGAFVLSNHSWNDPVSRFTTRAKEVGLPYMAPELGETVNIDDYEKYQAEWWQ